jgi:glycosyltransferase involved in cell wall biosynthesis
MKILHLIDSGGLYGAEKMLLSLASEQLISGEAPVIGSIRKLNIDEKPIDKEAKKRGICLKTFPMRQGVNLRGMLSILKFAKKNKFNIIHSHGYKTNILLGFLPLSIRGIPMISTLHGYVTSKGWNKMRINEALDAFSLRFVDKTVLVNKGMLSHPKVRKLPRNKVCIVNNGIEIKKINSLSVDDQEVGIFRQTRDFCSNGKIIASIGRLSKEKGYNYLIDAVSILRHKFGENVRLMLIGDGRLRDQLMLQAKQSKIIDSFFITGYITDAPRLLRYVDCYAISSLTEGLPITLLEAMALNTPIVATAVGGIPHVVSDQKEAFLVDPRNSLELAIAIRKVLGKGQLVEHMILSAHKKLLDHYSSEIMAKNYLRVYKHVLQAFNSGSPK